MNLYRGGSLAIAALFLATTGAFAETWKTIKGDQPISGSDLPGMLRGKRTDYDDGSFAQYNQDGTYVFTQKDGQVFHWDEVIFYSDGMRCLERKNGDRYCNLFVMNDGVLILIDDEGNRYAVKIR